MRVLLRKVLIYAMLICFAYIMFDIFFEAAMPYILHNKYAVSQAKETVTFDIDEITDAVTLAEYIKSKLLVEINEQDDFANKLIIMVPCVDKETINEAIQRVRADTSIFWVDKGDMFYSTKEDYTRITIKYNYWRVKDKINYVNQVAESLRPEIEKIDSEIEKIRYIYTWVQDYYEYDMDLPRTISQDLYLSLMCKRTVCMGFAETLEFLCRYYGINMHTMLAEISSYEGAPMIGHAFNYLINDEGRTLFFDVTHDYYRRSKGDKYRYDNFSIEDLSSMYFYIEQDFDFSTS